MVEDRKKQCYFLQDEFFAAEAIYNEAADHLQEAISNFEKAERSACDGSTDSILSDETKSSLLKLSRIVHFRHFL
ncbi:hypothetical protein HN011_007671, partial [Eciton burchellii]